MAKLEHWAEAYERILEEVRAEMPDADEPTIFAEYSKRCTAWKRARGIRG